MITIQYSVYTYRGTERDIIYDFKCRIADDPENFPTAVIVEGFLLSVDALVPVDYWIAHSRRSKKTGNITLKGTVVFRDPPTNKNLRKPCHVYDMAGRNVCNV